MTKSLHTLARRALWLLPVWTALLFLSTLTHQPDPQTAFAAFAAYITTDIFLLSHLFGSIAGAALGSIGVVALLLYMQDTRAAGRAFTGAGATIASNMLLTAVFGVAAFAQPAMGRIFLAGDQSAVAFYDQTYGAPLFATAMLGLLLFIVGGVLAGSAVAASGLFPRWTGWTYAIATAGFALSFIIMPVGMSVFAAVLTLATAAIAFTAARAVQRQPAQPAIVAGA